MKCEITESCNQEIKTALQGNLKALQEHISQHEKSLSAYIEKTDKKMKKLNEVMKNHLFDFEEKKRKFFQFDSIKSFLFWTSQVVSIVTLILLLYFCFGGV